MFHTNKTFPFTENFKCGERYTVSLPLSQYGKFAVFCFLLSYHIGSLPSLWMFHQIYSKLTIMANKQNHKNSQLDLLCVILSWLCKDMIKVKQTLVDET